MILRHIWSIAAVAALVLAIILDIAALSLTSWLVDESGNALGLFRVCLSNSRCGGYDLFSPSAISQQQKDGLQIFYHIMRTAAAMLILVVGLSIAAIVLLVYSVIKKKKTCTLIASFLCIQSICFIGIGVGVYHNTLSAVRWGEIAHIKVHFGAGFVLACLTSVICFAAFVFSVLAFRMGDFHEKQKTGYSQAHVASTV